MSSIRPWPAAVQLRPWQRRALKSLANLSTRDWLVVATPGGGKTLLALKIGHRLLTAGKVARIVVVTPSDHLRRQWAAEASAIGIDLDFQWSNSDGVESPDYCGVVVTYQQLSYAPDLYRMNCAASSTFVIFDELHHAGDQLDWGSKLRHAFENAAYRLGLSGTPFRLDNNTIPFVSYENGRSCADFEYGYGTALGEGVCRAVLFPTYEGRIEWLSNDGEAENRSLLDPLNRSKSSERLRAALCPKGDWLRGVLREADAKLSQVRAEGHPDAGGLVVALDQEHAKQVADLIHIIAGERPVLAISEDPMASLKIREFASSHARWLVAVKMCSEGSDIPRLRVGVYASNVVSELFFRQVIGRFVRVIQGIEEQSAYVFLPADDTLVRFALLIKQERDHIIKTGVDRPDDEENVAGSGGANKGNGLFTPLASASAVHNTIFDGKAFNVAELAHAQAIAYTVASETGVRIASAHVAAILRCVASERGEFVTHRPQANIREVAKQLTANFSERTLSERKFALRQTVNKLANRLAHRVGVEAKDIHKQWIDLSGKRHGDSTEEDLFRKQAWLIDRIREEFGRRADEHAPWQQNDN